MSIKAQVYVDGIDHPFSENPLGAITYLNSIIRELPAEELLILIEEEWSDKRRGFFIERLVQRYNVVRSEMTRREYGVEKGSVKLPGDKERERLAEVG